MKHRNLALKTLIFLYVLRQTNNRLQFSNLVMSAGNQQQL